MSKKAIIITVLIIVFVVIAVVIYMVLSTNKKNTATTSTTETTKTQTGLSNFFANGAGSVLSPLVSGFFNTAKSGAGAGAASGGASSALAGNPEPIMDLFA